MLQEDWFEKTKESGREYEHESGCCYICTDYILGCTCSNCKCRKCIHYKQNRLFGDKGGYCELIKKFGRENEYFFMLGQKYSRFKMGTIKQEDEDAYLAIIPELKDDKETWIPKKVLDSEGYIIQMTMFDYINSNQAGIESLT